MAVPILTPTITPTPTPLNPPMSADSTQEMLKLIHLVNNNNLPLPNILILEFLMKFPLPFQWFSVDSRIALYHYLIGIPFISSLHISPWMLIILINIFPLLGLLAIVIFFALLYSLIRTLPKIIGFIGKRFGLVTVEELAFLELTIPQITTKSAYATEQLYSFLHTQGRRQNFLTGWFGYKKRYVLEIVSSRDEGIRFIFGVPLKEVDLIEHSLLSYLPGLKIKQVDDYLPDNKTLINTDDKTVGVIELKLSADFVLPLKKQKILTEHDPISFLTGVMTKLDHGDLVALQVLVTPIVSSVHGSILGRAQKFRDTIRAGKSIAPLLNPGVFGIFDSLRNIPVVSVVYLCIKYFLIGCWWVVKFVFGIVVMFAPGSNGDHPMARTIKSSAERQIELQQVLNPYEQELQKAVKEKIDQGLFETSVRLLVMVGENHSFYSRASGFLSSLGPLSSTYQSLVEKPANPFHLPFPNPLVLLHISLPASFPKIPSLTSILVNKRLTDFKKRQLSNSTVSSNPILSTSELTDLYHFPYTDTTHAEGLIKSKSKDLPAPLSMKRSTTRLDVVLGKNTYGNEETAVGLTNDQHKSHMYVLGKTGMGKTTGIIEQMAYQDMISGKGVGIIDPHGDMAKYLLTIIPKNRRKDVIYFNPADKKFPAGLNLLLPGGAFEDLEEEHEWIAASLMSVFMKITPKDKWGQRLEHILRNAMLTVLSSKPTMNTPYISLLAIQRLLTESEYRKEMISTLSDPVLKQFWDKEFKLFGTMQQAEAISPVTNKLGEFITGMMTRHIVLQEKSTINISKIMDEGKILICNLSKGDLGEERSAFFGTVITSLFQLAAYRRSKIPEQKRKDFYLYIDEFQNFATPHFGEMFSEARKYRLHMAVSHQNFAQIDDLNTIKVVLGNSSTIICLKASPDDEAFIIPYLEPEVEKGEIVNLPPHHFFMKVTSGENEDAFSGETIPLDLMGSQKVAGEIIEYSRKHYATPREEVEGKLQKLFGQVKPEKTKENFNFAAQNSLIELKKEKGEGAGVKRKNGRKNRENTASEEGEDR